MEKMLEIEQTVEKSLKIELYPSRLTEEVKRTKTLYCNHSFFLVIFATVLPLLAPTAADTDCRNQRFKDGESICLDFELKPTQWKYQNRHGLRMTDTRKDL